MQPADWTKNPFVCEFCHGMFNGLNELFSHLKNIHQGKGIYPCSFCNLMFLSEELRQDHRKESHPNYRSIYNCVCCTRSFTEEKQLKQHEEECRQKFKHQCLTCQRAFLRKDSMFHHFILKPAHKGMKCRLCNNVFLNQNQFSQHMDSHDTEKKLYVCSVCEKGFSCIDYLMSHKAIHEKPTKPSVSLIYCNACHGAGVKTKEEFQKHQEACRRNFMYQCGQCSWAFRQNNTLTMHMNKYKHNKGRRCRLCLEKFMDADEYTKHMNMEINKKFICKHCNKDCHNRENLNYHVSNTHQQVERLCFICGWKTMRGDSYTRHMHRHKHGGQICDLCGFAALNMTQLYLHKGQHKPYVCPQCNQVIFGQLQMRTHYKKCQGILNQDSTVADQKELDETRNFDLLDEINEIHGKTFNCSGCKKEIKSNGALKHFNRKLICSKSHRCRYCSQTFKETERLKDHESKHKGPYVCSYCNRGFVKWEKCCDHMKEHIQKNTRKRQFFNDLNEISAEINNKKRKSENTQDSAVHDGRSQDKQHKNMPDKSENIKDESENMLDNCENLLDVSENMPGESEKLLGESENRPDESESMPDDCENLPDVSENMPGESEKLLGESENRPDESESMPDESENIPDEGENMPDKSGNVPDESENMPGQSGNMPDEGQNMPDESGNIPDQSENMPDKSGSMQDQHEFMQDKHENVQEEGETIHSEAENIQTQIENMLALGEQVILVLDEQEY